eukprot:TRINITY_DN2614_c0_g1_i1.p1 TRINITY_DN2614_c0_g1~~TRINITY_DN2614_c0_g1_i1.p1  ORF type:complete len:545 (+),score=35.32 TRINITY_DN2614_c0_g1_i1:2189-3823(+)
MPFKQNNTGTILNCNSVFAKLFGYPRDELINKPLTYLMHDLYEVPHTELLKRKRPSQTGTEEIFVFCQHRSKYVFPAFLKVLRTASMLNAFTYVASITDKSAFVNSKRAYVLLDPQLKIVGLSSAAYTLLKLDNYLIRDQEISISLLCPDITLKTLHYFYNKWVEVQCSIPRTRSRASDQLLQQQTLDKDFLIGSTKVMYRVQAGQIKFTSLPEFGIIGYYCMFATKEEPKEIEDQPESVTSLAKIDRAENFQFRFDPALNVFVRELRSDVETPAEVNRGSLIELSEGWEEKPLNSPTENERTSILETASLRKGTFYGVQDSRIRYLVQLVQNMGNTPSRHIGELKSFLHEYVSVILTNRIQENKKKVDYAEGVRTYRLVGNEIIEVNEAMLMNEVMDHEDSVADVGTSKKDLVKARNLTILLNSIKSKKALAKVLANVSMPLWIKILLLIITVTLFGLLGFSIYITTLVNEGVRVSKTNMVNAMSMGPAAEHQLLAFHNFREMLLLSTYIYLQDADIIEVFSGPLMTSMGNPQRSILKNLGQV